MLTAQAYARRLIRARNWHLVEAGRADRRAAEARALWLGEADRHQAQAEWLEGEIRALGFDPQPPAGPRAA
jgi:hypothetical protein